MAGPERTSAAGSAPWICPYRVATMAPRVMPEEHHGKARILVGGEADDPLGVGDEVVDRSVR